MTDKMQEEFKAWWLHDNQRELRLSCAEGWGLYIWESSRAGIEVELPSPAVQGGNCIRDHAIRDTLESLGLKVKP